MAKFCVFDVVRKRNGKYEIKKLIDKDTYIIDISDKVESIADGAFEGSSVARITLPDGIVSIGCAALKTANHEKRGSMYKISIIDENEEDLMRMESMLQEYAKEYNYKFNISSFHNAKAYLKKEDLDSEIIFLDIKMSEMDGLTLAKMIRKTCPDVIIIFCTFFRKFAIKCYDVSAFGFLVKPVQSDSFTYTLKRALEKLKRERGRKLIRVKNAEGYRVLPIQDIRYIEVSRHYLFYHLQKNSVNKEPAEEVIQGRGAMKEVEQQLEKFDFFRCNVSYLINLDYVTMVKGNKVYLLDTVVMISRNQKEAFTKKFATFLSQRGGM